jgi:hypothetical protein
MNRFLIQKFVKKNATNLPHVISVYLSQLFNNSFECVADLIKNLPSVFDDVASSETSIQHSVNELMETGSIEEYITRMWSTCPTMLKIKSMQGKVEDDLKYYVDDSTSSLPLPSVVNCVQESSKRMLKVTVDQKRQKREEFSCFGELYAQLLIEDHSHTPHYVSMFKEFPKHKNSDTNIKTVVVRCKKSIGNTEIIVLIELDSFKEEKDEGSN